MIVAVTRSHAIIDLLLRIRAEEKVRLVRDWLADIGNEDRVLDLGAGEGYVGQVVAARTGARVTLADVVSGVRIPGLEEFIYDGVVLPDADNSYDVVLLFYVLHHAEHPERVLSEAIRVARRHVIVVESVHEGPGEKTRFERIDRLLNRLRLGGRLADADAVLDMKTPEAWERRIEAAGGRIIHRRDRYRPWHRQALFLIGRNTDEM